MLKLSNEQITTYKDSFALFDKDGDGTITSSELRTVMRDLGRSVSERELKDMMESVDKNQNGLIDFDEFLELMARSRQSSSQEDELLEAFKVFDRDGNGTIDITELSDVMRSLGERLTEQELNEMINEADLDGDRKINFAEFSKMMMTEGK